MSLDRAARHNALVPELLEELRAALAAVPADGSVGAVVVAGEGASFSTGGDVAAFATHEAEERPAYARHVVGQLHGAMLDLIDLDVPVICAAHGWVTGGALGLLLAADVVVLDPRTRIQPWYVDVGFSPDGGWTALAPARVGRGRALAVQFGNEVVTADEARDWGMAQRVTEDPRTAAVALGEHYATKQYAALQRTKQLVWADRDAVAAGLDAELASFVDEIGTAQVARGMQRFLGTECEE